jgi:mono/diheme cytochrome c family protein
MRRSLAKTLITLSLALNVSACDGGGGEAPSADASVGADAAVGADVAAPVEPSAERGQAVYTTNCSFCHGTDGRSGSARQDLPAESESSIREAVRNGKSGMPSFGASQIDDAALADLMAYIKSL